MAYFAYKGRNAGGQLVEGRLEAATSGAVADVLGHAIDLIEGKTEHIQ